MAEETITRDELAVVLAGCAPEGGGSLVFMAPPERVAAEIFEEARRSREPEYEPGALYLSGMSAVWRRTADGMWEEPGNDHKYPDSFPIRPLHRLVLEGSPLADSERDLIHADLGKLLDLLGMGDFARPQSPHEVFLMCLEEVAKLVPETRPDLEAKLDRITGICRNPAAAVGEVMGPGRHVPGDRLAAAILAVIRAEDGTT